MTQKIDPAKLRAAAEHLEWVLNQYPDSDDVQSLLRALAPLLEDAKAGRITQPIDSHVLPGAYNFGEGQYIGYPNPSINEAYGSFSIELRGGLSDRERSIVEKMKGRRAASLRGAL